MKTKILTTMAMLLAGFSAGAQDLISDSTIFKIVDGVRVSDVTMKRSGDYFIIDMNVSLEELGVESNRAVLLTPRLVNASDSLTLPAVGVYGRTRYYYYVRNGKSMLSEGESSYRASRKPDTLNYHQVVGYKDWMDGLSLTLHRQDYGCCNTLVSEQVGILGMYERPFFPQLVYVHAQAEMVKERQLAGSAFVDFIVDRTDIRPEYRNNVVELGKIQATIDSLKIDGDITIKSVWLKGYASPESPYPHNTDLATGRTAAVKEYIRQLYNFPDSVITTDYEPENWVGLRAYVVASNIDNKQGILDLIDSDREPDEKEAAIRRTYPEEYRFLLQNCYPALRRTDYRIAYNIRTYSNIEEIKRIMGEAPRKLSLNEFNLLAREYEPGSEEFTEVYETAVRMYPNDEIANLNAANAALRSRDIEKAQRYIGKMGNSPEAVYARGAYAFLTGDFEAARTLFEQARELGVEEATVTLKDLNRQIKLFKSTNTNN